MCPDWPSMCCTKDVNRDNCSTIFAKFMICVSLIIPTACFFTASVWIRLFFFIGHDFHVFMLNYRLSGILKRYMPISFSKISLASSKCAAIYSGVWASEPRVIYLPPKSLYSLRISLDGCVSDKP